MHRPLGQDCPITYPYKTGVLQFVPFDPKENVEQGVRQSKVEGEKKKKKKKKKSKTNEREKETR